MQLHLTLPEARQRLYHLAALYLGMAHRTDNYLSDAEQASITERLHAHGGDLEWAEVQDIVLDALGAFDRDADAEGLALRAAAALQDVLTPGEKYRVLDDLRQIAGADGVVHDGETGLLARLARRWGLAAPGDAPADGQPAVEVAWCVLHDLAYVYLHLAHATDNELSPQEMHVMLNKLREWQPQYSEHQIQQIMNAAMTLYARGADEARLEDSIASVRRQLPHDQRMAALNDLVKIANADGVFLDIEEDMINHLVAAWDVDPYANYSGGRKE